MYQSCWKELTSQVTRHAAENLMVVTRAQSLRKAQDDLIIVEREQQCGVKPSSSVPLVGSEFLMRKYICQPEIRLRSQKRADCQHYQKLAQQAPTPPLSVSTDELRRLQLADTTLAGAHKYVTNFACSASPSVVLERWVVASSMGAITESTRTSDRTINLTSTVLF